MSNDLNRLANDAMALGPAATHRAKDVNQRADSAEALCARALELLQQAAPGLHPQFTERRVGIAVGGARNTVIVRPEMNADGFELLAKVESGEFENAGAIDVRWNPLASAWCGRFDPATATFEDAAVTIARTMLQRLRPR